MNTNKKIVTAIILIILIVVLLYLLILRFGEIEHHGPMVPTGNIDIFEIDCGCGSCRGNTKPAFEEEDDDTNQNKSNNNNNNSNNDIGDILVYDKYKIWDNKELRIFTNPAYEYESIIAPGSYNSYAFVIRNDNDFDIEVDILFKEENLKNINMQYKLRSKDKYILGTKNNYTFIDGMKVENVKVPAKGQISYILDWKWIDNYNDTDIGFDIGSNIKLSIDIGANEL